MMHRTQGFVAVTVACLFCAAATDARHPVPQAEESQALQPVLACLAITGDQDRLACYDKSAKQLQDATAKHDVVVVDQATISKARRSLFGFSMPSLAIFKGSDAEDATQNEIDSTVRDARRDADGNWVVTIEDGAVWHQTGGIVGGAIRPGEKVVIKRAALGSYFIRLGNRPGVRARREG